MCPLFCVLLLLSCKTTMTTVVITLVGGESTVKSSIKVSQVREVLPAGFPSEVTQLLESHQLANFITKGCQWFLWRMIPYPESCCLLLLTNVLATRSCLWSFQLPDIRSSLSASPWRSAGFLASCAGVFPPPAGLCVTWDWTCGVGVLREGLWNYHCCCLVNVSPTTAQVEEKKHTGTWASILFAVQGRHLWLQPSRRYWSDLMKTDVCTNRESGLFFSSIPSLSKRFDLTGCWGLMKVTCGTLAATCLFDFHTCIKSK